MQRLLFQSLAVLAGAILYSGLFWDAPMGLNTMLFGGFTLASLALFHRDRLYTSPAMAAAAGVLFSAVFVVLHHSFLAKFLHIVSFLVLIGFVQARELRFLFFGFLLGIGSVATAPFNAFRLWNKYSPAGALWKTAFRWVRIVVLPLLLGGFFFLIYYQSNDQFAALFEGLPQWFSWILEVEWLQQRGFSLLLGLMITGALLWPTALGRFLESIDQRLGLRLERRRWPAAWRFFTPGILALRRHYLSGLIALGLLNGLTLVLNITDLRYVWMNAGEHSAAQLSQYVHEGTYALIFSILVAMVVLIYFFLGNLNFYRGNERLKQLAYAWLVQNALLALSVGLRNGHYLLQYGLTYKRIGILAFLLLVLYGLWTLYLKIRDRRTLAFLLLRNSWACFTLLMLLATINWDTAITRYNLQFPARDGLDVHFLLNELSDQNLFILEQHRGQLEAAADRQSVDLWLTEKRRQLNERREKADWRSWNWPDYRNAQRMGL